MWLAFLYEKSNNRRCYRLYLFALGISNIINKNIYFVKKSLVCTNSVFGRKLYLK